MRHSQITLHTAHLAHNLATLKARTTAKVLAMVKANAYGHGVEMVVPALAQADGFGVACMSEALAVKSCLSVDDNRPIVLIEGVFGQAEWQQAISERFMAVIHQSEQLDYALADVPSMDSPTRTIWLKYNTGMNRLGFDKTATIQACHALIKKGYKVILTSHFACADDTTHALNAKQIHDFDEVLTTLKADYPNIQGSLCNSAGIVNFPHAHYDWVRTGIALYGSSPVSDQSAHTLGLKPAMTLSAKLMAIHHLTQGETVGYGGRWTAKRPARIGIISMGYGDGYPRVVNDAKVLINGQISPIVGRVAMDMMAIDISDCQADIGDDVILWGNDKLSIDDVAGFAGTIGYEVMCRMTGRPVRVVK